MQEAQNKMLDRSPRRSVSNFRDCVGGGSVNMVVRWISASCFAQIGAGSDDMVAFLATDARRSYSLPVNTEGGT